MDEEIFNDLIGQPSHSLLLLFVGTSGAMPATGSLLIETGDFLLKEDGDHILTE